VHNSNSAAQSTIYALLYSLRSGAAVLSRQDVRQRLALMNDQQIHEICSLLQKRDGRIAPCWSDSEIEKLLEVWTAAS
jgi:transposase